MFKSKISFIVLIAALFFVANISAQDMDDTHVVYIQTWKMKSMPMGDDGKAFAEMLQKQTDALRDNEKLLSFHVVRHFWGSDSRDLIMISEFKTIDDLFGFNQEMNAAFEKAFSEEENEKMQKLWDKYVGQHSDEIYQEVPGTRK